MLNYRIKSFIEDNIDLLDTNNFEEFYYQAKNTLQLCKDTGELTRVLLYSGIQPLVHLNEIPYFYYYGDDSLVHVQIPDNIVIIGNESFSGCRKLASVKFGSSVKSVNYGAFKHCSKLNNIMLNEGLIEINQSAFKDTSVYRAVLPKSLERISSEAFPELFIPQVYHDTYAEHWASDNGYIVEYID